MSNTTSKKRSFETIDLEAEPESICAATGAQNPEATSLSESREERMKRLVQAKIDSKMIKELSSLAEIATTKWRQQATGRVITQNDQLKYRGLFEEKIEYIDPEYLNERVRAANETADVPTFPKVEQSVAVCLFPSSVSCQSSFDWNPEKLQREMNSPRIKNQVLPLLSEFIADIEKNNAIINFVFPSFKPKVFKVTFEFYVTQVDNHNMVEIVIHPDFNHPEMRTEIIDYIICEYQRLISEDNVVEMMALEKPSEVFYLSLRNMFPRCWRGLRESVLLDAIESVGHTEQIGEKIDENTTITIEKMMIRKINDSYKFNEYSSYYSCADREKNMRVFSVSFDPLSRKPFKEDYFETQILIDYGIRVKSTI